MSVGPVGLILLWPLYLLWLSVVGLYWVFVGLYLFFVLLGRLVVIVAPFVWSLGVLGLAHLRARSRRPASS